MDGPPEVRASWPAAAVCRIAPVVLDGVGVLVPALRWSTLPSDRPRGWLILPIACAAIGLVVLVPQMLKPRRRAPEEWDGSNYIGFGLGGVIGVGVSWLRYRFGPAAVGLFSLAFGVGVSVATTIASTHSATWRLSLLGFVASGLGAFAVAALGGGVVRHFGRSVDRGGSYVATTG